MTDRIEINGDVMQGKPVIRGTRIPVEVLLRKLAGGATTDDLLDAYPRLVADGIRAALAYAAHTRRERKGRCPAPPYSIGTLHWRGAGATRFARVVP